MRLRARAKTLLPDGEWPEELSASPTEGAICAPNLKQLWNGLRSLGSCGRAHHQPTTHEHSGNFRELARLGARHLFGSGNFLPHAPSNRSCPPWVQHPRLGIAKIVVAGFTNHANRRSESNSSRAGYRTASASSSSGSRPRRGRSRSLCAIARSVRYRADRKTSAAGAVGKLRRFSPDLGRRRH